MPKQGLSSPSTSVSSVLASRSARLSCTPRTRFRPSRLYQIPKLVNEWRPAGLVVGVPTSTSGEPHKMTRQAEDFARRLERRFKLPVARVDERFTSVEAERKLRGLKRKAVDSVAAQLILEQYFDEAA